MRRACFATVLLLGCDPTAGPTQAWDPAARALLDEVVDDDYPGWTQLSIEGDAPHGQWSIIFSDPSVDAALAGAARESWPEGATLVCEGRDDAEGEAISLQIMRRDRSGWIWAQYDDAREPRFYGTDTVCSHCHAAGDDFVRSLTLPD